MRQSDSRLQTFRLETPKGIDEFLLYCFEDFKGRK